MINRINIFMFEEIAMLFYAEDIAFGVAFGFIGLIYLLSSRENNDI